MTLRIQRNANNSLEINNTTHLANMMCDVCGVHATGINVNTQMSFTLDMNGNHTGISCTCATLGGSCDSTTCWPLVNGTTDAQALAAAKTA